MLDEIAGLQDSITFARELGITTLKKDASFYGLSLVLGGGEVRPIDMVSAYSVFASGGKKVPPVSISRVEDENGRVIQENKKTAIQILDPKVTEMVTSILSDNAARTPTFGANSPLNLLGVSAKTGSTNDFRDAWTIGYNSNIVAAVWVGNNNNEPMRKAPGVMVSSPLWRNFMEQAIVTHR